MYSTYLKTLLKINKIFIKFIIIFFYTFSCLISLKILNSLKVLFAKILCSNAFSIFLMATKLLSESSRFLSDAATTTPYAPYPTLLVNIISINKELMLLYKI